MIAVNSNCSRVDAVKMQATQLKLQSDRPRRVGPADDSSRKVKADLETLDGQIKAGDAKKAELALAETKRDISDAKTAPRSTTTDQRSQLLDAYA